MAISQALLFCPRRVLAAFSLLLLACAVWWPAPAAAQAPAPNDRLGQQLREAVDRANASAPRPMVSSRSGGTAAPAPAAQTPSVTLSIDKAGTARVAPTASAPAVAPAARPAMPQAPAARGAPAVARPAVAPAAAGTRAAAEAAAPRTPAVLPRPIAARPADRYEDEQLRRQYERARAIANGLPIPASARLLRDTAAPAGPVGAAPARPREPAEWSYEGPGGPAAWASLKPEYQLCGNGQRQSPVHIEPGAALQGPNEALGFDYGASSGTVLHDGRTIRVEVEGDNLLQVRGATYRLVSFDFQHPAEEMVGHQGFAMGVHLVHRDAQGRTAIVAVLLQPGEPSAFIDKVWTYIPLDTGDRVRMPPATMDLATLLPADQRYYQFFGSMTTPPCEEGVLWMVLKQPVTMSPAQLRLFAQMFPANARPVQALNGRIVRDAQ